MLNCVQMWFVEEIKECYPVLAYSFAMYFLRQWGIVEEFCFQDALVDGGKTLEMISQLRVHMVMFPYAPVSKNVVKGFSSIDRKRKSKKRFVPKTPRLYKLFYQSLFVLNLRNFHHCLQKKSQLGIFLLNFNKIIVHKKGLFCGCWFTATLLKNNVNRFGTQFFFTRFAVVVSARVRRSRSRFTWYRITLEKIALRTKTNCRLKNQSLSSGIWYWVSGCFTGDVSS